MDTSIPAVPASAANEPEEAVLSAQYLYQNDLLLVALRDKLRLKPLVMVVCVIVLNSGVLFGLYAAADFSGLTTGYIAHALVLSLIAFPALAWLYFILPDRIADLFNTLEHNKVIGSLRPNHAGITSYEDMLQRLMNSIDSFWWAAGAMIFVGLYWLYRLLLVDPRLANTNPLWLRVAILAVYAPMMYSIVLTIVRLLVTLFYIDHLFRWFEIKVNPLHPDGSAGLGILGSMLGTSVFFVVVLSLSALTMNTSFLFGTLNTYSVTEAVMLTIFYVGLSLTLVVGWLKAPHDAMVWARNKVLQSLADEFQTAVVETTPSEDADAAAIKAGTDRLSELNRRYQFIQSTYPTWPADVAQIRRLIGTISLPAFIALLWPVISKLIPILLASLNNLAKLLHA